MKNISCDIIKDLIPLYYDNICSVDSKNMVEEHLLECKNCKVELNRIQDEIIISKEEIEKNRNDGNVIRNISSFWKRSRVKSFIKGLIISALLFSLIAFGYNRLFYWNISPVPTSVVEIRQVSQLKDGKIVFHVELTDGYALNEITYDMDEDGNFYMIPLRPIIKKMAQPPYGLAKGYDFFDIEGQQKNNNGKEIKALYYGTPEDHVLIWKKGMKLPKASEEIENMFHFE